MRVIRVRVAVLWLHFSLHMSPTSRCRPILLYDGNAPCAGPYYGARLSYSEVPTVQCGFLTVSWVMIFLDGIGYLYVG
jgi:hypothetical protein